MRNTWCHSYQNSRIGHELGDRYQGLWRAVIDRLLDRSSLVVAHNPEASELILGWMVSEPLVGQIHYVYTRGQLQGFGVARALLADLDLADWTATHVTADSRRIVQRWREAGKRGPRVELIDPRVDAAVGGGS